MSKKGPRYTPEQAQARIPVVVKRLALAAVDLGISLDKYPVDSPEIESRVTALSGLAGHLYRLCYVVWKYEALKRITV